MSKTKNFKNQAAEKQKLFVAGRNIEFEEYCILKDSDAMGNQFFNFKGLQDEIEKQRKIKDKNGVVKMPFKNMLRSEHIPYNFFIPLKLNRNQEQVISFFKRLLGRNDLSNITKFEIEWAPADPKDALNDKTSFDTYIQFDLPNNKKLGVGIEVKFTEKSYPFTETESSRLMNQDDNSPYYKIWNNNGASIYQDDSYFTLGKKEYKQFFRNHLLGLSMIGNKNVNLSIDEFISLHLFPSGNNYQSQKSNSYKALIKLEKQQYFKPITFEEFIEKLSSLNEEDLEHQEWLKYLKARYFV